MVEIQSSFIKHVTSSSPSSEISNGELRQPMAIEETEKENTPEGQKEPVPKRRFGGMKMAARSLSDLFPALPSTPCETTEDCDNINKTSNLPMATVPAITTATTVSSVVFDESRDCGMCLMPYEPRMKLRN